MNIQLIIKPGMNVKEKLKDVEMNLVGYFFYHYNLINMVIVLYQEKLIKEPLMQGLIIVKMKNLDNLFMNGIFVIQMQNHQNMY